MSSIHDDNIDITKKCDGIRREAGMSIAELARRIGVDKKRLWYALHGQREMRVDEFLKICIALKTDPRRFISRYMVEDVHERIANISRGSVCDSS